MDTRATGLHNDQQLQTELGSAESAADINAAIEGWLFREALRQENSRKEEEAA